MPTTNSDSRFKLVAPNGHPIVATAEVVAATTAIVAVHGKESDGTFALLHAEETSLNWNTQETKVESGQRIFVDSLGHEWPENKLTLVPLT